MRKFRKSLAAVLAVATVINAASCSDGGREAGGSSADATATTTTANVTTEDPNAALDTQINYDEMAAIEEVDVANEAGTGPAYVPGQKAGKLNALCYYDVTKDQPKIAEIFAERYGGTVETQICGSLEYFEKLGTLIAAGDSPDLVRYDWAAFPDSVFRNRYTALDEWLNMDDPLWADLKDVINSFEYMGKHYYYPQNIMPNFALIYNTACIEEANLENPVDLYNAGQWDWNKFEEMLYAWASMDEENIPFTGGSWSSVMFVSTTGTKIIEVTEDGITNNLRHKNVVRAMEWLEKLNREGLVGDGWTPPGEAFIDGKLLFLGQNFVWSYGSAQESLFKKGLEGTIEAVPFPRDPQAEEYYIAGDTQGYMVPSGAKNIQGAVQWILSSRIYETDPEEREAILSDMLSDDPVFYPKCPECKFDCDEAGYKTSPTCPECNAERRSKFKVVWTEKELQVYNDTLDPKKFALVYDNILGFDTNFMNIFVNGGYDLLDGVLYSDINYTTEVETQYNIVEARLDEYRRLMPTE